MNPYRRREAGRHRAIETGTWDLIRCLDGDSIKLLMYLWIGPQSTAYGILRVPDGYALTDLGWSPAKLAATWAALEAEDLIWREGELVVIVPFLLSNPPANANVVKGWAKALTNLPDAPLFRRLYQRACGWLTESGLAWLREKAGAAPETVSKSFGNGSATVPLTVSKLSTQGAVLRDQRAGDREQGEVQEGEGIGVPRCPPPPAPGPAPGPVSDAGRTDGQAASKGRAARMEALRTLFAGPGDLPGKIACAQKSRSKYTWAEITAEDPCAGLPGPAELASTIPDLELWDPAAAGMSAQERIALARRAEAAALDVDARITNSEGADCDYAGATVWYATSGGFLGSYQATRTSLSVTPVAAQNGQMQRDYWYSSGRYLQHLLAPEEVGRIAAQRTLRRLGARRVNTQQAPVVFDPETAAQLLGAIASALSGYALYRRASFLVDRLEQPVAAPAVTIVDDGTLPQEVGSKPYDGEGLPTRSKAIIDAGVLRSYLLDSYTARKLKRRPTGNAARGVGDPPGVAPTNFRLLPGTASPEEIIRSVQNGFYVTELIGLGINLATGDYSQGAVGLWIEKGELAYPVEEVTIAGNLGDMLQQVEAVGNDLPAHRAIASPTIKLARLTIAGE